MAIIGLFAGLVEVSIVAGLGKVDDPVNQRILLFFIVAYPVLIVLLFFLTLNFNRKVLYGPSDFDDQEHFMRLFEITNSAAYSEIENIHKKLSDGADETDSSQTNIKEYSNQIDEVVNNLREDHKKYRKRYLNNTSGMKKDISGKIILDLMRAALRMRGEQGATLDDLKNLTNIDERELFYNISNLMHHRNIISKRVPKGKGSEVRYYWMEVDESPLDFILD